jgi:hypothetical protein
MSKLSCVIAFTLACVVVAAAPAGVAARQSNAPQERFTAVAVNMGDVGRPGAGTVEMVVTRWSTEAEAQRLMGVLMEQGADKLLDSLRENPKVGYIRTPNSIGYDLHFARKVPLEDGGERVVLATDRYISFWEQWVRPRTIDYPFTVIEMRIGRDGTGEGKLSLATKVIAEKDKNLIVLENYGTQPVLLTTVKREPLKTY